MSTEQSSEKNIYASPESELIKSNTDNKELKQPFFTVSRTKLTIMCVCTLNLYLVYWFYKNWHQQRLHTNFPCQPVLRAIFSIFFTHSLFSIVQEKLNSKNIEKSVVPGMATLYVVSTLATAFLNNWEPEATQMTSYFLILIGLMATQFIPFWFIQPLINLANDEPEGLENTKLSALNWVFIIVGVVYWGLLTFGTIGIAYIE